MRNYQIAASLLSADFARLGQEAEAVMAAGADALHFDAMDNHFVPNLTIGPVVCASLRRYGIQAEINVHLMAEPIDQLIVDFAKAGASGIIFHYEASKQAERNLMQIRGQGCRAGIALKPDTTWQHVESLLEQLDFILVMSVNPGFGGQAFIPSSLDKIKKLRELILASGRDIILAVDGGIKINNIAEIARAGATRFVIGSAIFGAPDYAKVIANLREQLRKNS
ncbi:MAG TPA: ribulose-phosphate 3-epimerase [Gammaproteobacteria bacterium]|nr:ribulose-phosphate 3-epimerase [Gammaproteobacteria bacterium]